MNCKIIFDTNAIIENAECGPSIYENKGEYPEAISCFFSGEREIYCFHPTMGMENANHDVITKMPRLIVDEVDKLPSTGANIFILSFLIAVVITVVIRLASR